MTSILWFLLTFFAIAALTAASPAEKTLGLNARVVYLHGVWVWAAIAGFALAALSGLAGLLLRRISLQRWSLALGRTGLLFWLTYLPVSMWAMQTSWNGLYLSEPRWRLAVIFSITGLLLQAGLTLLNRPALAAASNLVYFLVLVVALSQTENVMHPPSPVFNSDAAGIQLFFLGLQVLMLLAVGQVARGLYHFDRRRAFAS